MMIVSGFTAVGAFTVETDFPGGNAIVESVERDTIHLAPDYRDSPPWFYWHVAVKGAAGQTLHFVLKPAHVGVLGPGVSLDGGATWKWLGADAVKDGTFSYTFPADANDVHFSVGMPYVSSNLESFLSTYKDNPFVHREVLTKSNNGRDVPLLLLSDAGRKAPYAVAFTARHHCSEMMGNYVLEGIIQGILAGDERGKWLREHVDFFIVPFVDMDGVEEGDQGKNRQPHDHNRDYGDDTIYPEVMAIKERLPAWANKRPLIFIDIHDPALKNDIHEVIQFLPGSETDQNERFDRFLALLERDQQGLLLFKASMVMKHGTGYNKLAENPPLHSSGWARTLPNSLFGVTLEMPYANASGYEVNAHSAREFGRDIAWALQAYLEEVSKNTEGAAK